MKAKLREDRQEEAGPNDIWSMDFVHDQLAMGKIRVLTVVDTLIDQQGGREIGRTLKERQRFILPELMLCREV